MLKHYFKTAIAVLKRRKFFTFISLFGISFTITILLVITAFLDFVVEPGYPDMNRDRSVHVFMAEQRDEEKGYTSSGPLSYYFINEYIMKMDKPEAIAVSTMFKPTYAYINNRKIGIDVNFTNDQFWKVFQFDFTEGKPYSLQQMNAGDKVAVITESTKRKYFGETGSVVGKFIRTDNEEYLISGVVKGGPITSILSYGEMFLPYTLSKSDLKSKGYLGEFHVTLLAGSAAELPAIQREFQSVVKRVPVDKEVFTKFDAAADPYPAMFTRTFSGDQYDSGYTKFLVVVGLFYFLFMLIPAINLVNINMSRIMERSSEIAVRKAFGASSGNLTVQFIVENLILTLLGGLLGGLFAAVILHLFNRSEWIEQAHLVLNGNVLLTGLGIAVFFGLLSGVYPAWRMSKLPVIKALKIS